MRPSDAIRHYRPEIRRLIEYHRLHNAKVFGSTLHGTDQEGSDLDLLVDPSPDTTLMDLSAAQLGLTRLLGLRVDLLTPGDLPAKVRQQVIDEARPL
jgi:predicted nucleotidyltransferase